MNTSSLTRKIIVLLIILASFTLKAQSTFDFNDSQKLRDVILHNDSLFWKTYNTCDIDEMQTFFTEDLEFYHDRSGLTTTLASFMDNVKNGLCGSEDWRLRREVVEGSLVVYPLPRYGAILTGEHVFYINEKGKKEYLDGRGKFLHIWRLENNEWKMSRVVSYDHGPAVFEQQKKEIALPIEALKQFEGHYKSSQTGTVTITLDSDHLTLESGGFKAILFPEKEDTFFIRERDVQFKFMKGTNKKVQKMTVIENGELVDEATKID